MRCKAIPKDGYTLYENEGGPDVAVSGASVIYADGFAFRDLSGTGELLPYEDWRLTPKARARDLAARLDVKAIAGLMMYSPHQMVPCAPGGPFRATYGGRPYDSSVPPWTLSDGLRDFVRADGVRHVLLAGVSCVRDAVRWNNALQALAESLPLGIPVNISSDPRHGARSAGQEYKSGASFLSQWPEGIGLAATFDPALVKRFAEIAADEYRAIGIATALSPQIDLATDPRWMRLEDTFGPDPELATAMARAYCDGMQTTPGSGDGWGRRSVATMAKHWPGGGTGEGGRDAHYAFGAYAVYPGGQFETHLLPFLQGAMQLSGPTGQTACIMPYYTVSWDQDRESGENVGNAYSRYIVGRLLRETYGYDGILCTDWGITGDPDPEVDSFGSRCFGVEKLSAAERHLRIIENGVDQFGGNSDVRPILEAYRLGCERCGEAAMRSRMEQSAVRLLTSMFRLGLFENPYLDEAESAKVAGCAAHRQAGEAAQRQSLVLLKNEGGCLPLKGRPRVFVPDRFIKARRTFFRGTQPEATFSPVPRATLKRYFDVADRAEDADAALVFVESPLTDPFSREDRAAGGNGYMPISLQYRPYTASAARKESIAGGDARDVSANRSYWGKTAYAYNESDLENVRAARAAMKDKPVIVCIRMHNPAVMAEIEPLADAIIAEFGVGPKAILDLMAGLFEPSGRLPVTLPCDMETVERSCEDAPHDLKPYVDEAGHAYRFGFGMRWSGPIERNEKEASARVHADSKQ